LIPETRHEAYRKERSVIFKRNRLNKWGLWTLKERNRADLIEVFKMIKGLSATPWSLFPEG